MSKSGQPLQFSYESSMDYSIFKAIPTTIFVMLLANLFSFSAEAKVFKWTDENGKVHYSDKPFDEKSQQLKMKHQPSDTEVIEAQQRASSLIRHQYKVQSIANEEARDKQIADGEKEQQQNESMQACKEAKRMIWVYGRGKPIYTTDQNGKKNYKSYTDEQKNKMIAELQEFVKKTCAGK
jgi:hypothetical protein